MSEQQHGNQNEDRESLERTRINSETATIGWHELQRFFAQGHAVAVSSDLDLVEVAYQVSSDNKPRIEEWMANGRVGPVSDAQALEWLEARALMWSVVVRPWVLVQPVLLDNEQQLQEKQ
jgi:hypothetical protein